MRRERLGDILITSGRLTEEQLKSALEEQERAGERLGRILVAMGYILEDDLINAISEQLDVPIAHPMGMIIDQATLGLVSKEYALAHLLIPVSKNDSEITIAMADPLDLRVVDDISARTGLRAECAIAPESEILQAVHRLYTEGEDGEEIEGSIDIADNMEGLEQEEMLRQLSEQAPVVRVFNTILLQAVDYRATDIHIEPGRRNVVVRMRVDGILRRIMTLAKGYQLPLACRIKVIADMDIAERRRPQDGRTFVFVRGKKIDLRISSLPSQYGEKIVLRLLDKSMLAMLGLDALGFDSEDLALLKRLINTPNGLVVVTGPAGCGKTTTLYACLNYLRSEVVSITTVEDPIEYELPGVIQTQVRPAAGVTFAGQLRAILRQDPNIILLGEIRDLETAEITFRAALTGHLVLTTLHTNDAPSSVIRLMEMGIQPYLIPSCLTVAMAQRLVRLICLHCKEEYQPSEDVLLPFRNICPEIDTLTFYRGKECQACGETGFQRRTAIAEIMPNSRALADAVLSHATAAELKDIAISEGMHTLLERGLQKALEGATSLEEVLRVAG